MKALVFGEVLWDIFGEEKKIGGAALNFAAHLASLGDEAQFCSAVGQDELGRDAREVIKRLGVGDKYVSEVEKGTGACYVTLDSNGQPDYNLLDDIAYDYIEASVEEPMDMIYIGTLARRREVSRRTAKRMIDSGKFGTVFLDVNVRKPFISKDVLDESLKCAQIVKLSREEAGIVHELGLLADCPDAENIGSALTAAYSNIRLVIVTLDKDGALAYDAETGETVRSIRPESKLVSAVGAGDSFSACFMHNYLAGRSISESLNRAVLLSDYVVTQLGAVPECPKDLLEKIR